MGSCQSCNTVDPPVHTPGDAPEKQTRPRPSIGSNSSRRRGSQLSAPPHPSGRNSLIIGAAITNPQMAAPAGGYQQPTLPPCGAGGTNLPPCGADLPQCGHDLPQCGQEVPPCGADWSSIPAEDQKILRPCYDCAPPAAGGGEITVEKQPRMSHASHKSEGMVSYGVVPERGLNIDEAPAFEYGGTMPDDSLPNDWESLQRLAAEGKIVIHDDNEGNPATHEEIRPGVYRAAAEHEQANTTQEVSAGGGRYSWYKEGQELGNNNLQINLMHEIQAPAMQVPMAQPQSKFSQELQAPSGIPGAVGPPELIEVAYRRQSRNSAHHRESHNSAHHRESHNSAKQEMTTEVITNQTEVEPIREEVEEDLESKREEVERRASQNDHREEPARGEEGEAAEADLAIGGTTTEEEVVAEVQEEHRHSRRSKKKRVSRSRRRSRRRRDNGKSRRKKSSGKKSWFGKK